MGKNHSVQRTGACPCGSGGDFGACCEPRLTGEAPAPTAVALMRSRYTAYITHRPDYLLKTWHPDTRPGELPLNKEQRWLGLRVLASKAGGPDDQEGTVEFVARFKLGGRGHRLHEISRFLRTAGGWHYLDGIRGATDSSLRD